MPPIPWFNFIEAEEEGLKPVDNYVPESISPNEVLQKAKASKKQQI